jgi:hypothetical protein
MENFKFFTRNQSHLKWRTKSGVEYKIQELSELEIENIIKCFYGTGSTHIPNPYNGKTKKEWLTILHNEINRRKH